MTISPAVLTSVAGIQTADAENYPLVIISYSVFPSSKIFAAAFAAAAVLLSAERLAVCALVYSGILLMGSHYNVVEGTVIGPCTMMGTLLNSALNTLIGMTLHNVYYLLFCNTNSIISSKFLIPEIFLRKPSESPNYTLQLIDISAAYLYNSSGKCEFFRESKTKTVFSVFQRKEICHDL